MMLRALEALALPSLVMRGFIALSLCALTLLSGCNEIGRPGPGESTITKDAGDLAGFTLIDINADTIPPYMLARRGDAGGTVSTGYSPRIRLSPGDVIKVNIAESKEGGLFAPLSVGGTAFTNVRVDHRGMISLPYAGRLSVQGLDTQAVEDRIKSKLSGVTFEPQIYVELVADRSSTVLVTGAARSPGRFSLLEGPLTIIDAINRAGGPAQPAYQTDVVLRRGHTARRMPLSTIEGGRNIQLQRGDEIVLESNLRVFNALGAVAKTGQMEFPKAEPSLLDALATAGGLQNNLAHNTGVFVFRLAEPHAWLDSQGHWQPGPVIFKFDMSRPETLFYEQAFALKPNDTIYVTNAPAVEWVRAIAPIASTMAAFRGGISTTSAISNQVEGP
jgi:polysaccharide biosynthesis/export protein